MALSWMRRLRGGIPTATASRIEILSSSPMARARLQSNMSFPFHSRGSLQPYSNRKRQRPIRNVKSHLNANGEGWLRQPTRMLKPLVGPTCSIRVSIVDRETRKPMRKSKGYFMKKMATMKWKRIFGMHGKVLFVRPGKNFHFVCFRSVEDAARAQEALSGCDASILTGGSTSSGDDDFFKIVTAETAKGDAQNTRENHILQIDWAIPQNVRHPLFDEMRLNQDSVNPGWKAPEKTLKSQRSRRNQKGKQAKHHTKKIELDIRSKSSTKEASQEELTRGSKAKYDNIVEEILLAPGIVDIDESFTIDVPEHEGADFYTGTYEASYDMPNLIEETSATSMGNSTNYDEIDFSGTSTHKPHHDSTNFDTLPHKLTINRDSRKSFSTRIDVSDTNYKYNPRAALTKSILFQQVQTFSGVSKVEEGVQVYTKEPKSLCICNECAECTSMLEGFLVGKNFVNTLRTLLSQCNSETSMNGKKDVYCQALNVFENAIATPLSNAKMNLEQLQAIYSIMGRIEEHYYEKVGYSHQNSGESSMDSIIRAQSDAICYQISSYLDFALTRIEEGQILVSKDVKNLNLLMAIVLPQTCSESPELAMNIFDQMAMLPTYSGLRRDAPLGDIQCGVEMCNMLIASFLRNGHTTAALNLVFRMIDSGIGRDRAFLTLKKKNTLSKRRRSGDIYISRPNADTFDMVLKTLITSIKREQRLKYQQKPTMDQTLDYLPQAEYVFQQARRSFKGEVADSFKMRNSTYNIGSQSRTDTDSSENNESSWIEQVSRILSEDKKINKAKKWKALNLEQEDVITSWNAYAVSSVYISFLRCCHAGNDPLLAKKYYDDMIYMDFDLVNDSGINQAKREFEIFSPGVLRSGNSTINPMNQNKTYADMIRRAGRSMDLAGARKLFEESRSEHAAAIVPGDTWASLIHAELWAGNTAQALTLFHQLRKQAPDQLTVKAYRSILTDWFECSRRPKSAFFFGANTNGTAHSPWKNEEVLSSEEAINCGLEIFDLMYADCKSRSLSDSSSCRLHPIDYAIILDGLAKTILSITPPPTADLEEVGGVNAWLKLASMPILEHAERIYSEMVLDDRNSEMEGNVLVSLIKCLCLAKNKERAEDQIDHVLTCISEQLHTMSTGKVKESLHIRRDHINKCFSFIGNTETALDLRNRHAQTLRIVFDIPPQGYLCRTCFTAGHYRHHCPNSRLGNAERSNTESLDDTDLLQLLHFRQRRRRHLFSLSIMESLAHQEPEKLISTLRNLCTGTQINDVFETVDKTPNSKSQQVPDPHAAIELLRAMNVLFPKSITVDHSNALLHTLCSIGDFYSAARLFDEMCSEDHKLYRYFSSKNGAVPGEEIPSATDYFDARSWAGTTKFSSFDMAPASLEANTKTYTIFIGGILDKSKTQWNDPLLNISASQVGCEVSVHKNNTISESNVNRQAGDEENHTLWRVNLASKLFESMRRQGMEIDQVAYGTLLQGLCRCGHFTQARQLFESEMARKGMCDARASQTVIGYLCQQAIALKGSYVDLLEREAFDDAEAELDRAGRILSFAVQVFDSLDQLNVRREEVLRRAKDDASMKPIRTLIKRSMEGFDTTSRKSNSVAPRASDYFSDQAPPTVVEGSDLKLVERIEPNKDANTYRSLAQALLYLGDMNGASAVYKQSMKFLDKAQFLLVTSSYTRDLCHLHRDGTITMMKKSRENVLNDAIKCLDYVQQIEYEQFSQLNDLLSSKNKGKDSHGKHPATDSCTIQQKRFLELICIPFSSVISSLCLVGRSAEALKLFNDLKAVSTKLRSAGALVSLDERAYNNMIRGLCYNVQSNSNEIEMLHLEMKKKDLNLSPKTWTSLIKGYLSDAGKRHHVNDLEMVDKVWSMVEEWYASGNQLTNYQCRILMRGFSAMKNDQKVLSRMRLLQNIIDQDGIYIYEETNET